MPRRIPKENEEGSSPSGLKGLALLAFCALLSLSLISFREGDDASNWLGLFGYALAWIHLWTLGFGSYLWLGYMAWRGWYMMLSREPEQLTWRTAFFAVWLVSSCLLLSVYAQSHPALPAWLAHKCYSEVSVISGSLGYTEVRTNLGGAIAYFFYFDLPEVSLYRLLSPTGTSIVFGIFFAISMVFSTQMPVWQWTKWAAAHTPQMAAATTSTARSFLSWIQARLSSLRQPSAPAAPFTPPSIHITQSHDDEEEDSFPNPPKAAFSDIPEPIIASLRKKVGTSDIPPPPFGENITAKPKPATKLTKQPLPAVLAPKATCEPGDFSQYQIPPLTLLTPPKQEDQSHLKKDLKRQAEILTQTLASFGIEATVGAIHCGPTITSFEIHPAVGVKVQRITSLQDDIALSLAAKSLRIIAPIPGRSAVGIEIPSTNPQEVSFRQMMEDYSASPKKANIPVILGKAVNGDNVISDLSKMPHCIIAGATGSGKSVCINTLVMSILMTARPDEIRLLMVDPKKVELTPYNNLPHMIAPVITEPLEATQALNWIVREMEMRYEILKQLGLRNIAAFNTRTRDEVLEESLAINVPEKFYHLVAIIDELADLMMVATNDIETPIARIAQMARAVGIHMVLATQRPSREVITGLIKANFPTRIAFKVASRINSQIILDDTGAETLLGNGDMLFLPPGSSSLVRAQGAFVRDEDINRVIDYICQQCPSNYLIQSFQEGEFAASSSGSSSSESSGKDSLYDRATEIVIATQQASTTFLQRKLKIGYARAASLMDELEENGVIGPSEGAKPRRVLLDASHL